MSGNTDDWARAGFHEVNGELVKINDAKRTVSEIAAADTDAARRLSATVEEAKDEAACPQLPHTEQEKLENGFGQATQRQAAGSGNGRDEARNTGMDREGRSTFRISVTLHVSNYGRRDPIGALETICDLVTATRRRLSERFSNRDLASPVVRTGKRGRNHRDRTAVVKGPIPF